MCYNASRASGQKRKSRILTVWALFTARVFPGAQSFVFVVPSQQQKYSYPHSSAYQIECKIYSSKTALFVRNSDQRRRQPASSRKNNRRSNNHNPAIAINQRLVELGQKKQWRQLLEVAEEEQASLNKVNYATIMNQLGRIRSFDRSDSRFLSFLQALATRIEEQGLPWIQARQASNIVHAIGKMQLRNPSTKSILNWISTPQTAEIFVKEGNPHDIANVVWACATLSFEARNLFAEIELRSKWFVEEGTPQAVANMAWACATLGFEAPNLFSVIESQSKWLVEEGDPQAVSNVALACAKLGYESPKLFAEIERRSQLLVKGGTPQAVSNTAWACAKLDFQIPNLFAEIEHRSKWLVEEGKPQEVANTAWACATLGFDAPTLFAEIESRSRWLVKQGNPQVVANTAWACATLGLESPKLFAEIEHQSKWLVESGTPQGVANTAWACAKLGYEAPNLFAEIECQSKWLVETGDPQNVANTAWACATLGFEARNLFAEIERQSKWLVKEGKPQEVANIAWAFATLGYEALELIIELDRHAVRLIENANLQDISNTCYAIAVLGKSKDSKTLLAKLWDKAIELSVTGEEFIDEAVVQLAQTLIFAEADGVNLLQIPLMAERIKAALNSMEDNEVSRSSKKVSQLLNEIGFQHECEVIPVSSLSGGMLAIDFASTERKIAIEFDGSSHFLKAVGTGKLTSIKNGATKAKRRYLEQIGWTVINMDYRDYIRAKRVSNEKQWLWKLLNASGVSLLNEKILKHKTNGVAGPQRECKQKKVGFLSAPAIYNRILFKNVVKKDSTQFEAALVQELTERGITSIPMTKSNKPDFLKMKATMKAWALEGDNDPKAKQDKTYRASFVPKCPALWTSVFEELQEQSDDE